jgi:hypothetical protein
VANDEIAPMPGPLHAHPEPGRWAKFKPLPTAHRGPYQAANKEIIGRNSSGSFDVVRTWQPRCQQIQPYPDVEKLALEIITKLRRAGF